MVWAVRKKGFPEIVVKAVMFLFVKVGVHQRSVLSPFLFALVVDEVNGECKKRLDERNSICK